MLSPCSAVFPTFSLPSRVKSIICEIKQKCQCKFVANCRKAYKTRPDRLIEWGSSMVKGRDVPSAMFLHRGTVQERALRRAWRLGTSDKSAKTADYQALYFKAAAIIRKSYYKRLLHLIQSKESYYAVWVLQWKLANFFQQCLRGGLSA